MSRSAHTVGGLAAALDVSVPEATRLVGDLRTAGLVEIVESYSGPYMVGREEDVAAGEQPELWLTSIGGNALAKARIGKPMSRTDAQKPCDAVIARGDDRHGRCTSEIIEARREQDAPPTPCHQGTPAGQLDTNGTPVTLLTCPPLSRAAQAAISHGEGAHAEHLLGYWHRHGIIYVVSIHGTTATHRALITQLISSIELTQPTPPSTDP